MKRKLLATILPTISLATIVPLTIVPIVATSETNSTSKVEAVVDSNKLESTTSVASINDVTVTFTPVGIDVQQNAITSGIVLSGNLTQKIRKNKEFMMLKAPTATLADAEFRKWQYTTDGSTWTDITPGTKIFADMTIRPVFDITACDKIFYNDSTTTTPHWSPLNRESLCGTGDILKEDGTVVATRADFNKNVLIGRKVTSIPNDFLSDCTGITSARVTFEQADSLAYIGENFMFGCSNFESSGTKLDLSNTKLAMIDNGFMSGCTKFAKQIVFPTTLTKIGNEFMYGCESFNTSLTLPTALASIGSHFMEDCKAFNQDLTLPLNIAHIGEAFMYDCTAMDGKTITINCSGVNDIFDLSNETLALTTQPETWTGITIAGLSAEDKTAFRDMFKDSASSPFRKLLGLE